MEEVQNKWDTLKLNDDIWAKLIYFEQNRRLAKAYVSAPVLTVDGSTNGLDGFRIGLSGIDNTYRNLDSVGCLRSIGQGVKLKIDNQGNILIRKISQQQNNTGAHSKCSVWIRDWPGSSSSFAPSSMTKRAPALVNDIDENCMMREIEQPDVSYKLFDMRKFRNHLERRRMSDSSGAKLDWRQCVSIISFVRKQQVEHQHQHQQQQLPGDILEDPCWIMMINIIAIDMIKSIICDDRNLPINGARSGQIKSSTLAYQHSLLNNGNTKPHERTNNRDLSFQNSLVPKSRLLKASSSTSVLYQPALADLSLNEPIDGISSGTIMSAANNRAKKPRTSNLRSRPSSLARDNLNHRRYQSSQQLSNSNIIYTTFNSNFINHPRTSRANNLAGDMSTSDYYSGSRSSTNGYSGQHSHGASVYTASSIRSDPHRGYTRSSRAQVEAHNHRDQGSQVPFARGQFVRKLEHNRSLSSFDLTFQKFDFKPIRTAIRMNYDHFSESEDFYEQDDDESFKGATASSNGNNFASEIETNTKSQSAELVEDDDQTSVFARVDSRDKSSPNNQSPSDVVDHHECQAMHNNAAAVAAAAATSTVDHDASPIQKLSRSSLTSSSSSSGCADNDYFMSQSSSSVSSSSASNERELLSSQPASSSGIACSGNTSDEYDDNRKHLTNPDNGQDENVKTCALTCHKLAEATKLESKKLATKRAEHNIKQTNRRGYKIKLIEPPVDQVSFLDDSQDCGVVCDCEPVKYDCDCCCDCMIEHHTTPLEPLNCCSCDTESTYDFLAAPPKFLTTSRSKSGCGDDRRRVARSEKSNDTRVDDGNTSDQKKASPEPARSNSSGNNDKLVNLSDPPDVVVQSAKSSSPGWLEKRKYSRILPKFIFPSSSSSRRIEVSDDSKSGGTQRKSSTLDRLEKFRLTRSTQNLS